MNKPDQFAGPNGCGSPCPGARPKEYLGSAAGMQERQLVLWTTSNLLKIKPGALQAAGMEALREWRNILETALRRERNRGIERHYRYSLNRHIALKQSREFILELQKARASGHKKTRAAEATRETL